MKKLWYYSSKASNPSKLRVCKRHKQTQSTNLTEYHTFNTQKNSEKICIHVNSHGISIHNILPYDSVKPFKWLKSGKIFSP